MPKSELDKRVVDIIQKLSPRVKNIKEESAHAITFEGEIRHIPLFYADPTKLRGFIEALMEHGLTEVPYKFRGGQPTTRALNPEAAEAVAQNAYDTMVQTVTVLGENGVDIKEAFIPYRSSVYNGLPTPGTDLDIAIVVTTQQMVDYATTILQIPDVFNAIAQTISHPWVPEAHLALQPQRLFLDRNTPRESYVVIPRLPGR